MGKTTDQAKFWEGDFGDEYIGRNRPEALHSSNVHLFSRILTSTTGEVNSVLELGANIGVNFLALRQLLPDMNYTGVEINTAASRKLHKRGVDVFNSAIEDFDSESQWDLVFTKGVLIHLNPESLASTYEKMVRLSSRYILVAEYFNPSPVAINYRGEAERLFKRDFAGEMLDTFEGLVLRDYGFAYSRGPFPQDNISWFLMESL